MPYRKKQPSCLRDLDEKNKKKMAQKFHRGLRDLMIQEGKLPAYMNDSFSEDDETSLEYVDTDYSCHEFDTTGDFTRSIREQSWMPSRPRRAPPQASCAPPQPSCASPPRPSCASPPRPSCASPQASCAPPQASYAASQASYAASEDSYAGDCDESYEDFEAELFGGATSEPIGWPQVCPDDDDIDDESMDLIGSYADESCLDDESSMDYSSGYDASCDESFIGDTSMDLVGSSYDDYGCG